MKRSIIVFGLILCGAVFSQAQQEKLIAVAALGKTQDVQISQRAGRAPYYLLFDKKGKLVEVINNPFYEAARGAGPKVARLLAGKNVGLLLAGGFGDKMIAALDEGGINHQETTGMVKDAINKLIK
jgi:predicted Fe-Mo cluster-binding NifX family protein